VIRFSALLVVVGIGLLIAGGVTSRLLLIYIAIGVSAVALLFLIIGAIVKRAELFGREPDGIAGGQAEHGGYADELAATPEPAATAIGAARSPAREHAGAAGHGVASVPARPREVPFPDELVYRASGGAQPGRGFAGYEQFAKDAERRGPGPSREGRPSQPESPFTPQRPFVEPEPTRMDWAADLREAERQERERQGQGPGRPQRPGDRPDRAGRPVQNRPDQSRPDHRRPDQGRPGQGQPQRPFVEPNPTRMDWAAGLREADQQERERQGKGPEQPGTRVEPSRAEATRAEPVQTQATRAEPAQAQATRAEKVMAARPDGDAAPKQSEPKGPEPKGPEAKGPEQPAEPSEARQAPDARAEAAARAGTQGSGPVSGSGRSEVQETASPARDTSSATEDAAGTKQPAEPSPTDRADTPARETASPAGIGQPGAAPTQSSSADQAGSEATPAEEKEPAPAAAASDAGPGSGPDDDADADQKVTVVPGVPRYHRSECILIRFMGASDLQRIPVEQAREAGCTPCRACQPDGEEDDGQD
jgi:hypothetical protein